MHPATKAALAGIVLVVLMMLLLLGWVRGGSRGYSTNMPRPGGAATITTQVVT